MHNHPLPTSKAPWVVGRETLFEHAAADFLQEVTRQRPWCHARYEALLEEFSVFLDPEGLAPLAAFTVTREVEWLATLDPAQCTLAIVMLHELREYIHEWGWLSA